MSSHHVATVCKLSEDMKELRGPTGRFAPLVAQPYIRIQEKQFLPPAAPPLLFERVTRGKAS